MPTITLFKAFVAGMTDYVSKHNANYTMVDAALNQLFSLVTGQSTGSFMVPDGLKQIFDRRGIVGIGSYDFTIGAKTGPAYNIVIGPGAYWDGSANFFVLATSTTISMAGKVTGTYYVQLDVAGNPTIGVTPGARPIWSFTWTTPGTVSVKALYATCNVLFDGDDYADQLTSAARSKNFTKVADRLEEIEGLLSVMSGYYGYDHTSGLSFYYLAGLLRNDADMIVTPAGSVVCVHTATNYIEVNPADGTVSVNQVGFTAGQIPLWVVTTSLTAITTKVDKRTWCVAGTGGEGGGGGHSQNTDIGTSSRVFTLARTQVGVPTENASLEVVRGDLPTVDIKWDESEQRWKYTNDGYSWFALGDISLDLGAQLITKYVAFENPPKVWEEVGRSPSVEDEDLDLSSYISALHGVEAVCLQVFFMDTYPDLMTNVRFKKKDSPYYPLEAFSAWGNSPIQPVTIMLPVDENVIAQFFVNASGHETGHLKIYLLGYFEKVVGVGTQKLSFVQTVNVLAGETKEVSIEGFCNRGLCYYVKMAVTGSTGLYDFKLLKNLPEPELAPMNYYAASILPAVDFDDNMPFWVEDAGAGSQMHLQIVNHDLVNPGVFTISTSVEKFA